MRLAHFLLPLFLIGDDTEIVIGELKVVLLRHAIAVQMRVMSQLAILFEHLGRVSARPAVDPVRLLTAALLTIVTAATPTVIVVAATIVIQG